MLLSSLQDAFKKQVLNSIGFKQDGLTVLASILSKCMVINSSLQCDLIDELKKDEVDQ